MILQIDPIGESYVPGWAAILVAVIAGPLGGAIVWYASWRRSSRKDAMSEWQELVDHERSERTKQVAALEAKVDRQDSYIRTLLDRMGKAEVAEARCKGEVARLESENKAKDVEVRQLQVDVRKLQEMLHMAPPGVTAPCRVIASVPDGVIVDVSIEVGSMFHWTRDELIGQPITALIAQHVRPVHRRALQLFLKRFEETGEKADPSQPVRSDAQTKEGTIVPVSVFLSGPWRGKDNVLYINADIARRGDSDFFGVVVPHGPKEPTPGNDAQL